MTLPDLEPNELLHVLWADPAFGYWGALVDLPTRHRAIRAIYSALAQHA